MHHPINANSANTLHCLGKKLSVAVSFTPPSFIYFAAFNEPTRQLFGEDEDSTDELDEAEKQGENGESFFPCSVPILSFGRSPRHLSPAQEIENLRKEAQAFKSVRAALRSRNTSSRAAKMVFQKVQLFHGPDWPFFIVSQGIPPRCPQPPLHGRYVAFPR
jgi:hypothetical protein